MPHKTLYFTRSHNLVRFRKLAKSHISQDESVLSPNLLVELCTSLSDDLRSLLHFLNVGDDLRLLHSNTNIRQYLNLGLVLVASLPLSASFSNPSHERSSCSPAKACFPESTRKIRPRCAEIYPLCLDC
jgi:hypothetical protein